MTFAKEDISQWLIRLIKVGVFLILFLPLVMNSHFFFPFIVVKNVFFRIIVEVIFVAYLILAQVDSRYRPHFDKISLALLTFFGVSIISALVGIGLNTSVWGNYERMSGLFHFFHLVLYFFVLANVFKTRKDWHSFFTFSIFASLLMSFLALAQWLEIPFLLRSSGGRRLSGTLGNATFFAAYLIFNLFFVLYFWAKEKRFDLKLFLYSFLTFDGFLIVSAALSKLAPTADWGVLNLFKVPLLIEAFKYPNLLLPFLIFQVLIAVAWFLKTRKYTVQILLSVVFLFEFFIFFNTQTRGAVIGFFAGLAFLAFVSLFGRINIKIRALSLGILIFIVISPLILVAAKNTPLIQKIGTLNRLATISLTNITTESRLVTWLASWQGWKETPKSFLIGYGPENYYYAFNKYFPPQIYKDSGSQIWFDRAHNIIFDLGVTTGFIGLISYFSIFGFAVLVLFKSYQKTKVISSSWLLVALLVAYVIQNLFVFDTLNSEILFYLFLAFVVFLAADQKAKDSAAVKDLPAEAGGSSTAKVNYIYVAILLVVLVFSVFGINIKTLKANNYIYQALVAKNTPTSSGQESVELFRQAISQAVSGKFEARQQLANFVTGLTNRKNVSAEQLKANINYAAEELAKSVAEEPKNIRHYIFLSTFYNATTRHDLTNPQKVVDLLEPAISLSPTRSHIYYEIAQAYVFMGNFDRAREYFERGISLAPRVFEDRWALLGVYILFNRPDLADEQLELMQKQFEWTPKADDYKKLVDFYGRVKNYNRSIEFQNKVIELEQTAANYAQLAALYAKIGENQKAREATSQAVKLDPNFADEAELFLEKLNAGELLEQ